MLCIHSANYCRGKVITSFRNIQQMCSMKQAVVKILAIFTGKLFIQATLLNRVSKTGVFQ